ncbi:MAG: hypothetical protein IPP77_14875 [Bacteroidetes bacterium]|nr:hypothetical protein [Bacteroidota bacterium]
MKNIFLPILLGMSLFVSAQFDSNPNLFNYTGTTLNPHFNSQMRDSALNRITASFDYFANSNSVPAMFAYKMIFKGQINNTLKDRANRGIKNRLAFEDYLNAGFDYQRYLKKWDGMLYFGYHHRQMRNLSGSKETYQLLFYGNAMFEDDTVDLSGIRFQNFIYNQYTFGIQKTFRSNRIRTDFGLSYSFLQVMSNQQISTRDAWLYTAPDGEYLDMQYDLKYNSADEGATPFTEMNGIGFSGDLHLSISEENQWKLALDVSDLGVMSFSKHPVNYTDTGFVHFQGIEFPNLFSFNSATFGNLNIDSALLTNLPKKTNKHYSVMVPFTAALVYSQPIFGDKLVISVGGQYRHIPRYFFYGYLKANYFIRPDMVFSASMGGGGYSKFNLGFEFSKSWKYFDFTLGTGNIIGLVVPTHYTGTGLYLRLGTSF